MARSDFVDMECALFTKSGSLGSGVRFAKFFRERGWSGECWNLVGGWGYLRFSSYIPEAYSSIAGRGL